MRSIMKFSLVLSLLVLLVAGVSMIPDDSKLPDNTKVLRHVVLFKFKDSSSSEAVNLVVNEFRGLKDKVSEIYAFEWGTDVSPEGLSQGFTHCFIVSFLSEADRNTYLPHPAHQAFVKILQPHLDKVCVVDYWASH